jgi:hypothetical protein
LAEHAGVVDRCRGFSSNRDIGRSHGGERLRGDYYILFVEPNPDGGYGPTFSEQDFTRRFRISRLVYDEIKDGVLAVDDYFAQKRDALGVLGASPDQKIAAALRQLSLGAGANFNCRVRAAVRINNI